MFTFSGMFKNHIHHYVMEINTNKHLRLCVPLSDFIHKQTHGECFSNQPKLVICYLLFQYGNWSCVLTSEPLNIDSVYEFPKVHFSCISLLQYYSVLGMLMFQRSEPHMLCIYRQFLVCMWNIFYMDHRTSVCVRARAIVFLKL